MENQQNCLCGSGRSYAACCEPLHTGRQTAADAEALMRSRYCAYVLQHIDYIVETTVPVQQHLLDKRALRSWSENTRWLGLTVLKHIPHIGKIHAQVEFVARFQEDGEACEHHELSAFVLIGGRWYFIDPTVPLPTMKQPCFCGSGKKFKACCGQFFK
ncbi:YchJ family protein [Neisseria animalis]|uniref:UPF0225 protein D0T90_01690 n=1 Tax=Neisseria animalis TaxID=492 RepID=A0A5P3MPN2_NEIAN|nr:YchJ family protein [Neisseria animalis]QEY23370.1 YchJ family protein [Neisseria animalis]ROW33372.1 YchJ family protein [Neisseria animalis]